MAKTIKNIRHLSKSELNRVLGSLISKVEELENKIIELEGGNTEITTGIEVNFLDLTNKEELEEYGKTKGFDIDRRKSIENIKEDIIEFLQGAE